MMGKRRWFAMTALLMTVLMAVACAQKTVKTEGPAAGGPGSMETAGTRDGSQGGETSPIERGQITGVEGETMTAAERQARERFVYDHIHFAYDSAVLSLEAQTILREKARWLRDNPGASVIVEGHCDERGTTEYNLALGDRRAESVRSFLVNLGISAGRMTTVSYGEERPLDAGHNEAAWAKNRRAQFVLER